MCADSTTPSFLAVAGRQWSAGREVRGKRDLRGSFYHPPCQLLRWRLGLKDCCNRCLLQDLLKISRMPCSVAVSGVMVPTVSDIRRKKSGMERRGPTPTYFRAGWPCGSDTGGAAAAAAERLRCWTASRYIRGLARVLVYVALECAPTRRVLSTSPSLAGWLGGGGERGTGAAILAGCSGGLGLVEAWKDMLLPLALAGPAGDLKNALIRRRLG